MTELHVRTALEPSTEPRVLLVLPWDVEKGWMHPLDYEVLFREAQERGYGGRLGRG